jgi:hypothetical protein
MFEVEIIKGGKRCPECGGHYDIHVVTCSHFHCKTCGNVGASPEHYGGCPTNKKAVPHAD